jgi:hypothetical protein
MGLFCLAMKDTIEDDIESAIGNLKLFLEDGNCEERSDYLLDFATKQIEDARKRLKQLPKG